VNFQEAIEAMNAGKYVLRAMWAKGVSHTIENGHLLYSDGDRVSLCGFDSDQQGATDWEIVSVVRGTMDFSDALRALKDGKRVRRAVWGPGYRVAINQDTGEICDPDGQPGSPLEDKDILADDWSISET